MSAVETNDYTSAINKVMDALQDAQETVVNAKAEILAAPKLAGEAKEIANGAKTTAESAKATADAAATKTALAEVKTTADATKAAVDNATTGLAATKAIADAAKTTAEAALPKSGEGTINQAFNVKHTNGVCADIKFVDGEDKLRGKLANWAHVSGNVNGESAQNLQAFGYKEDGSRVIATLELIAKNDGATYATCPPPRGLYNNDISTTKWVYDHCPQKILDWNLYVGGENASDTADLWNGRGRSADKPFASFFALIVWVANNSIVPGTVSIRLQDDLVLDAVYPWFLGSLLNYVHITSYPEGTSRVLTCPKALKFFSGQWKFRNLVFNFTNTSNENEAFEVNGIYRGNHPTLILDSCELNGTVGNGTVVNAWGNASVFASNLTGNITGKKYNATRGSKIFGTIPGTTDGTADASSTVVK